MRTLRYTRKFKKDMKRVKRRGKNIERIMAVVDMLAHDLPLPASNRDHKLIGNYAGTRECHVEPDWLLIYRYEGDSDLILVRTGTHSDLFK